MTRKNLENTVYQYSLVGKGVHILAELYKHNTTMRFGLVDIIAEEEIKESLIGNTAPKLVMITPNGMVYKNE